MWKINCNALFTITRYLIVTSFTTRVLDAGYMLCVDANENKRNYRQPVKNRAPQYLWGVEIETRKKEG